MTGEEGEDVCTEPVVLPDPSPFEQETAEQHLHLDPVPASAALARSFVRGVLGGLPDERRETVVLLTSELVTNAILHARTPVTVGVVHDAHHVLVAVDDRAPVERSLQPRTWSRGRPGGRGLALVADLSQQWGTRRHSGGKSVWSVLPVTAPGSMVAG